MLDSVKIQRRQSEIRQALAELVGKETPTEDETRQMAALDTEYRQNETRYRAALVAEDTERREGGADLETRSDREFAELVGRFELRQVALALDEGRALEGATAEIVAELRNAGGYRGVPVPWAALETREGETLAADVPNPVRMRPLIDRLFPDRVAGRMGAEVITLDSGALEVPVVTDGVTAGWADGETAPVPVDTFATASRTLRPDHNLGVQVRITRRALKQAGPALEAAIRRDMQGAMGQALDRAVFLGSGANGEPLGVITGAAEYDIDVTAIDAAASWAAFRAAVVTFMSRNAAGGPAAVRALIGPEVWAALDDAENANLAVTEWQRLTGHIPAGNIVLSTEALPDAGTALLATNAGGVSPIFVGLWGAVDMIRDPYTDAQSGGLRITAIATADVSVARGTQLQLLTGLS